MQEGDKVRLKQEYHRIVNKDMCQWIIDHREKKFTVESTYEDKSSGWPVSHCVKLYKLDFWITEDLLEKI